jgi:hypothetical protein
MWHFQLFQPLVGLLMIFFARLPYVAVPHVPFNLFCHALPLIALFEQFMGFGWSWVSGCRPIDLFLYQLKVVWDFSAADFCCVDKQSFTATGRAVIANVWNPVS